MFSTSPDKCKVMPKSVFAEIPDKYKLSAEQLRFYDENGYVVIKQLVDFASLYSYKRRFQQICSGIVPRNAMTVQKIRPLIDAGAKPEEYTEKVQDILYDEVFSGYFEYPPLLDVVSQLVAENLTAIHSMFINKPPGTGAHPMHQDMYYFPIRPIDKVIGTWTAVDDVTIDNGCLYVLPGSHKLDLIDHRQAEGPFPNSKLYYGIHNEALESRFVRVNLEMSPGDTVFFHSLLWHGSGPNGTKNYRKAISGHFASSECTFISPEGTPHGALFSNILAEAKRRGYQGMTAEDVIQYRSKQVRGVKSNL